MNKFKKGDTVQFIEEGRLITGEIHTVNVYTKDSYNYLVSVETNSKYSHVWKDGNNLILNAPLPEIPQFVADTIEIPQFVADTIERDKKEGEALYESLYDIREYLSLDAEMYKWLRNDDNVALYTKAWIQGYKVKKEQLYYVRVLKDTSIGFLNQRGDGLRRSLFIDNCIQSTQNKTQFTKDEVIEIDENLAPFMVPVEELDGE